MEAMISYQIATENFRSYNSTPFWLLMTMIALAATCSTRWSGACLGRSLCTTQMTLLRELQSLLHQPEPVSSSWMFPSHKCKASEAVFLFNKAFAGAWTAQCNSNAGHTQESSKGLTCRSMNLQGLQGKFLGGGHHVQ